MKYKNTTVTTLIAATLLSACAMQPKKENTTAKYHLHFYGAKNDSFSGQDLPLKIDLLEGDMPNSIGHGVHTSKFPLTYAIECNQDKSACKHAVVKTDIEFSASNIDEKTIKVSGILHSEMGRNLTTSMSSSSFSGTTQVLSMRVPDSVELINETKVDQRFEKTLKIGEKYEIKGLAGVHVDINFQ
jgi:hypothetical protein